MRTGLRYQAVAFAALAARALSAPYTFFTIGDWGDGSTNQVS